MKNKRTDPNAKRALKRLKYEIADDISITRQFSNNPAEFTVGDELYFRNNVQEHTNRMLLDMGEQQVIRRRDI